MLVDLVDAFFSREHHYSLGHEQDSNRAYLSIPVSNGVVDYEEYYELDEARYSAFLEHPDSALQFADECRLRQHDDLLIQKPGRNRGTPV